MDPIEKAIRSALLKGNPEDKEFRNRIYASAEQALERSLATRPSMTDVERIARVKHLRTVAASIETEFMPATLNVNPDVRVRSAQSLSTAESYRDSAVRADPRFGQRQSDEFGADAPAPKAAHSTTLAPKPVAPKPSAPKPSAPKAVAQTSASPVETRADKARRSRLFNRLVGLFVFVTFAALAIMFGWAIWSSGLFNTADNAASQNSGQIESGAPLQAGGADDVRNWITVFEPSDISTVELSDGVTADLQGEGKDAFLRIAAGQGVSNGLATFEVQRGVLETLSGKKVVFDVRAHTSDGAIAEIAVNCELAGMGQCQRTRFRLEGQTTDNLLIVQLADTGPEASGTLSLTPDLGGSGNPVDIQSIRVRVEQ